MARLALCSAPGPRGLWEHTQAWVCVRAPTGWPEAQTYRNAGVAWRAGGSRHTRAEESATPGLTPFSFLPRVPSVTLLPLWTEMLVSGRPALVAGVGRGGADPPPPPAWRGQGEAAGSVWSPGLEGLSLHPRECPPNQARDGQCPMRGGQRGVLGGPVDGRGISAGIRGHPPSVQLLAGGSRTGTALQEVSNGASMRHCTASFIYTRAPAPPPQPRPDTRTHLHLLSSLSIKVLYFCRDSLPIFLQPIASFVCFLGGGGVCVY